MGQEKSLLAALVAALSALAHCRRGQALVHCGEAQGRPLAEAQCPLSQGRGPVWGAARAAQGAALETERGLCHDSWVGTDEGLGPGSDGVTGVICLRNCLLRSDTRPLPSTLTLYLL